jgi:ComF family protein
VATLSGRLRSLLTAPTRWPLHGPTRAAAETGWSHDPPSAYCFRCGATAAVEAVGTDGCPFCVGRRLAWDRVVRLGEYADPLDQWIVEMKFRRGWWYAPWMGIQLAQALGRAIDGPCVVCPVPMPWPRRWRRGYNQAFLMAEALAQARGWPMTRLLRRTRYTAPQTAVAPSRRTDNIRGSFALRSPVDLAGWTLCLVDDVKTTGATASACARLLRDAGAERVILAVAAVADPRGGRFQHT